MATQIARNWRMKSQRYQLAASVCSKCNATMFQPRTVCTTCAEEAAAPIADVAPVATDGILIHVPHNDGLVIYHRKFQPKHVLQNSDSILIARS